MKVLRSALCLLGLLVAGSATAAPKNIILSDSLLANADKWNVDQGAQWMGIHKWRFGEYAVVASKKGWTTTSTDTNFFKTKMESETANEFSFVLSSKTNDSAFVSAAHEIRSRSNPGLDLGHGWTVGGDGGRRMRPTVSWRPSCSAAIRPRRGGCRSWEPGSITRWIGSARSSTA